MRKRIPKILVTGAAGFIGSAFVKLLLSAGDTLLRRVSPADKRPGTASKIVVVDSLTYAGDLKRLKAIEGSFKFYNTDICSKNGVGSIFAKERPDIVVHFAAESHVDRSISDAAPFINTNIKGTQVLIDAARKYGVKKFIFISSDEVYGEIAKGKFNEQSLVMPNSPYAASKAAADLLVQAYFRTHKLPAIIVRPSNNYGPWQYPEKLIPVIIYKALKNEKVPLYARGLNVREWLYVDDCAGGILKVMEGGKAGEIYNIGSGSEHKNIEVAKVILDILGRPHSLIKFVQDRPGHDIRYSLDSSKIRRELNWRPAVNFDAGIEKTVNWYVDNLRWLKTKVKF